MRKTKLEFTDLLCIPAWWHSNTMQHCHGKWTLFSDTLTIVPQQYPTSFSGSWFHNISFWANRVVFCNGGCWDKELWGPWGCLGSVSFQEWGCWEGCCCEGDVIFPTIRVMKSCMNRQMDGQTTSPLHHRIRNIYKTDTVLTLGCSPSQ